MFRNLTCEDLEQILRSKVPDALHVEVLAFTSDTQREKYPEGSKVRPSTMQIRPHEIQQHCMICCANSLPGPLHAPGPVHFTLDSGGGCSSHST